MTTADTCKRGHSDWYVSPRGVRACRRCRAIATAKWFKSHPDDARAIWRKTKRRQRAKAR
jgi:hypothetical protein